MRRVALVLTVLIFVSSCGGSQEQLYRVMDEEPRGGCGDGVYLRVVVEADSEDQLRQAVEQLSDDYSDRDSVHARIYDSESSEAPIGTMRAANSGCGEAQTGVSEDRYEFEYTG